MTRSLMSRNHSCRNCKLIGVQAIAAVLYIIHPPSTDSARPCSTHALFSQVKQNAHLSRDPRFRRSSRRRPMALSSRPSQLVHRRTCPPLSFPSFHAYITIYSPRLSIPRRSVPSTTQSNWKELINAVRPLTCSTGVPGSLAMFRSSLYDRVVVLNRRSSTPLLPRVPPTKFPLLYARR